MDDSELLIRIDRHLDTTTRYMRLGDEHMRRGNELMEANREAFQDLRVALREMNLRSEKVMGEVSAHIREMTEESRAQRGALLAILDRLGAGPAPEAT